jgi:hypothetical protein
MHTLEEMRNNIGTVVTESQNTAEAIFGVNVHLPVHSLSREIGVQTMKQLVDSDIIWISPLYHRPKQQFLIFFEFESQTRCLKVFEDTVIYDEKPR